MGGKLYNLIVHILSSCFILTESTLLSLPYYQSANKKILNLAIFTVKLNKFSPYQCVSISSSKLTTLYMKYIALISQIKASNRYVLYIETLLIFYRFMLYMFYCCKSYIYIFKNGHNKIFNNLNFVQTRSFKGQHDSGISAANAAIIHQ